LCIKDEKGDSRASRWPVINKTTQDISFVIETESQQSKRFFSSPKHPDQLWSPQSLLVNWYQGSSLE
jgi:hypothetical protein